MDINDFLILSDNLKKNITEIKSTLRTSDLLDPLSNNAYQRTVYLFQSITKSIVKFGNGIIIEGDFRTPLNTADVFICLAEHNVIPHSIVPGLKKAAIAMPRIGHLEGSELLDIIANSVSDLNRCLNAFEKYFKSKESEV